MKALTTYNLAVKLGTNVTAMIALIDDATKQGTVDLHSDQSWYGLPDGVAEDIKQAYELVTLASNKLNTVLTARTALL